jgi:hypothetical protein
LWQVTNLQANIFFTFAPFTYQPVGQLCFYPIPLGMALTGGRGNLLVG